MNAFVIGVFVDAISNVLQLFFFDELGGRRLCGFIGAVVPKCSGNAVLELRPHSPFRSVS